MRCWCGSSALDPFSPEYAACAECGSLVNTRSFDGSISEVSLDEKGLYGREYWYTHQEQDLGYSNIEERARRDLPERCLYWLRTLLRYKAPPGKVLELGCAHGGFVALLQWAGFEATGLELSPSIAEFAHRNFEVPVLVGPVGHHSMSAASIDVIALMDVMEHLPDPVATMRKCMELLKPDGLLLIQTPCYPEGKDYQEMVAGQHAFLQQLKANEHIFLLSARAIHRLFASLGAAEVRDERPIFSHYDQFVVVGKSPLPACEGDRALGDAPAQRLVQAMLDLQNRTDEMESHWQQAEADRAARLSVIEEQGARMGAVTAERNVLAAELDQLRVSYQHAEADRAARLGVIEQQGLKLAESESQKHTLAAELDQLRVSYQHAEADRAARLVVIQEQGQKLAARLAVIEEQAQKLAALEDTLQQIRCERDSLSDYVQRFERSRTGRVLNALGLVKPPTRSFDGAQPERQTAALSFNPSQPVEVCSLPEFVAENVNSRPDLADVREYNHHMIDIFADLQKLQGTRLLDVGASPHGFALERALARGVSHYCGIGIGVMKNLEIRNGTARAHLLKMNAEEMLLPSDYFDRIISLSTFEHFFHPDLVLNEMHRVLRPGGTALVSFQPIWTSARGHHLHHLPAISRLIPAWAHLRWTPDQMQAALAPIWPANAAMKLDQVIEWIYHSDEINRIDINQLRAFFSRSPLRIEWITPLEDEELTDAERLLADELTQVLPYQATDLRIKGFSALLFRD